MPRQGYGAAPPASRLLRIAFIVSVCPHRWAVPREAWGHLFGQAERETGILVYSGYFMAEDADTRRLLAGKAESGTRGRILPGDPDSPFAGERGHSEGIEDTMPSKVRSAIAMYRPLLASDNIEIRLHGTILYNSIYRADEQMLAAAHIDGTMANNAPVFHLRKIPGGDMVAAYLESFERVRNGAKPYEGN